MRDKKPSYFIEVVKLFHAGCVNFSRTEIKYLDASLFATKLYKNTTIAIFKIYPHEKTTPTNTAD